MGEGLLRALNGSRLEYLDSIRGIGAAQVLVLHFFTALAPSLVSTNVEDRGVGIYIHASPLAFLYDGSSAVFLFFVLSGYVLTEAYRAKILVTPPGRIIAARATRLGIPAVASVVFAALVFAFFRGHNSEAGEVVGSAWFRDLWHPELSVHAILRDAFVNSLLLAYQGLEPINSIAPSLQQNFSQAFNAPLWTLSIELYGSALILLLCWTHCFQRRLWPILVSVLLAFFVRSSFLPFLIGHLLAVAGWGKSKPSLPGWVAWALIAIGVGLCISSPFGPLNVVKAACGWDTHILAPCHSAYHYQKTLGAIIIFVGVIQLRQLRTRLEAPALRWLGKMSFPLYLVHWPILFGPTAGFFVLTYESIGVPAAQVLSIAVGIVLTVVAAMLFRWVDNRSTDVAGLVQTSNSRRPGAGASEA